MTKYLLHPACRVRKEKFGLLFYDLRGPRILFVETADLLGPEFFQPGGPAGDALRGKPPTELVRLEHCLRILAEKGFICEQPVC